jgi:hypothetical protein
MVLRVTGVVGFFSAILLKQQSADGHVGHIMLIPNQPVFALFDKVFNIICSLQSKYNLIINIIK